MVESTDYLEHTLPYVTFTKCDVGAMGARRTTCDGDGWPGPVALSNGMRLPWVKRNEEENHEKWHHKVCSTGSCVFRQFLRNVPGTNMFGSTNLDGDANPDGDGFTLSEEYARELHPRIPDEVIDGGFSVVRSHSVTMSFTHFPHVTDAYLSGVPAAPFSAAPPATGAVSLAANSHPALGDWDGDGDLDLFVGGSNGMMRVFENAGSPRVMNLVERTTNFAAIAFAWTNVVNPAPALGDFTGDGCADLAVGGGTGGVWLVESGGVFQDVSAPSFVVNFVVNLHGIDEVHDKVYDEVGKGGEVGNALTGALQTNLHAIAGIPTFGDIDGDGWVDLLILNADGTVSLYPHTHAPATPYASAPATTDLLNYTVPNATGITTGDVNEDGVIDVLISDDKGSVWEFHGKEP